MNNDEWVNHSSTDTNLEIFLEEFEKLKGQHIIVDFLKIERFIAIADGGDDWYYITFDGKDIHWHSCVGHIIPLRGHLLYNDYEYIIRIARLNHMDQLCLKNNEYQLFLDAVNTEISQYPSDHKFMTELCWELN
jgi:hypothetical protein